MGREYLGEFEQVVLLALIRLGEDAYGVRILREIELRTGRQVALAAIYNTLNRLEEKAYVSSWIADPTPVRGGRAKRYFRLEQEGLVALQRSQRILMLMAEGLDLQTP